MDSHPNRNPKFTWFLLLVLLSGLIAGSFLPASAATHPASAAGGLGPQATAVPGGVLPTAWAPLNDKGLNNSVYAIAVYGTNVYVGGMFTSSYDGNAGQLYYIARYDTVTATWHALGKGFNNYVRALAVGTGGILYAGGDFTALGDNTQPELKHIAKWNGISWSAMSATDDGLNGTVYALAYDSANNDLWVGGSFTDEVSSPSGKIKHFARFNTGGTGWSATQCNGLNADVRAIAVSGSNIYVGGSFSQTGDASATCSNADKTHLNKIAKYSGGSSWTALTDWGVSGLGVNALAVDSGGNLFVGGSFSETYAGFTKNMNNFAIYSGGAWVNPATFHNGLANSSGGNVNVLAVVGGDLYAGGTFTRTSDSVVTGLNNLAIYRLNNWVAAPGFGLQIAPLGGSVDALGFTGLPTLYNLYAGGAFDSSGDGLSINLKFATSLANACNANSSGNWNSVATWSCGEVPTAADQVTIPNGTTITLNVDATLNGKLTLNGTLDGSLSGKTLTLGPNAVISGAGDILGAVQRLVPPLGTTLAFNNALTSIRFYGSTQPAAIKVTLTKGKPGTMSSYVARKYTITPTGSFDFADIKLAYKTSELVNLAESNLKLWRFDTVLNRWTLQGGTVDLVNHLVAINNVYTFSTWGFFGPSMTYKLFIPRVRKN